MLVPSVACAPGVVVAVTIYAEGVASPLRLDGPFVNVLDPPSQDGIVVLAACHSISAVVIVAVGRLHVAVRQLVVVELFAVEAQSVAVLVVAGTADVDSD